MNPRQKAILQLAEIPGVGASIADDLSNKYAGAVQDRCLLYVFRCAVYYANTDKKKHNPEKLKWWNWKEDAIKQK